jgi:ABC-type lipoprotein release transport system permease subunit
MTQVVILIQIALRNLFSNFLNIVIGGIIFVGTFFFVVGSSLLDNIDNAMSKSIIGSVAGHIQVYSDKSKDELAIFGDFNGFPDLGEITDFSTIKEKLGSIENIKSIVPMGINGAEVSYGNTLDRVLEKLRKSIYKQRKGDNSAELKNQIESYKSHVKQIIGVIKKDFENFSALSRETNTDKENSALINKAASDAFWKKFDKDPLNSLEYLENNIASLLPDADYFFLSYTGTDLDTFKQEFDRMEIVDGKMVPKGSRGMLLSKFIYEHQFKLKTAARLDDINEAIDIKKSTIAKDPDLQFLIKQNKNQTSEIIYQLDPAATKNLIAKLNKFLGKNEKNIGVLLPDFFDMNDGNFKVRYAFFYKEIAPMVELYRLKPGDILTIKAYTKGGFIESINIKVYGTFQFKGLEKSGFAGGLSLMDLMSFRDLYGYLTPEKIAEAKAMEKAAGVKIIPRDQVEDELFGSDSSGSVVAEAKQVKIDEKKELGNIRKTSAPLTRVYSQKEIESGVVLNAAVILKNASKIKDTMKKIQEVSAKEGLGLKPVTWQKAAGFIGQFVTVAKVILYLVVFIIFIVALVVINNAVMMATLQRTREIGTMRAIGSQRWFVLAMILVETLFLGLTFGAMGTLGGSLVIIGLGSSGIPAVNEFMFFFFSGPKLFPVLGVGSVIGSLVIIVLVTSLSALYPAILATRVSPLTAMQSEE